MAHHWIAGEKVSGGETAFSSPATGEPQAYPFGTPALIDQAVQAAAQAFLTFAETTRAERAALLDRIADEIEACADAITAIACAESGLPEARIVGERGRTTFQLRFFAGHIRDGAYLDRRVDAALPDRQPLPRPEMRMIQRPIGPVGVFGASNFPLAFSVAGGDTASALAAGCPVVVKGHPAHPGTSEIVAEAISAAVAACNLPGGVFSMVHDGGIPVGQALAQHPLITAIGFTGSLRGGRALYDICVSRPTPIPFFGELGSVNPVFMLPAALAARGAAIGSAWAASLTMGAGQFCTNPGVAIVIDGPDADAMANSAVAALNAANPQTMLTDGIADAFRDGAKRIAGENGVRNLVAKDCDGRRAAAYLFETDGATWLANASLGHEVFGPLAILIRVKDVAEMLAVAKSFEGQLTATLQMDDGDMDLARSLLPTLETMAGRVLANGFPTGVEVADTMVHSGPYPASTNFGATSVGSMAIRRWLRPVCYQNLPVELLPADLR